MKTHAFLAAVLALTCACSSSTSDRPSTTDEQRAAIERDRERERAAAEGRPDSDAPYTEQDSERAEDRAERAEDRAEDRAERVEERAERADDREGAAAKTDATEREPDNTGRNERDDEPGNLTALDQSNSASDVDITQAIRKKVVADDALSFNAKNVKIITVGGKVTLRGPVASAKESAAIEKSARAVPGVVQVDNQIEVKR